MATTEKLIVELDAKVGGYVDGMGKADNSTKDTDKNIENLGKKTGKVLAGMAVAALAAATAMATMVVNSGKAVSETERLAAAAKLTTGEFESLAFATSQYGIDADKIADISKDLADRLGEFATAGTGAFQDFADVTKITKKEAIELAESWKDLSSDDVLGQMVSRMEDAGASANDMTFVMESMAGDLSRLTPLFKDNGSELKKLRDDYNGATEALSLTKKEADDLKESAATFDLLSAQLGKAADKIAASVAPIVTDFFNAVIEIVPDATSAIVDFILGVSEAERTTRNLQLSSEQLLDRLPNLSNSELSEASSKAFDEALQISFKIAENKQRSADLEERIGSLTNDGLPGSESIKRNSESRLENLRESIPELEKQLELQNQIVDAASKLRLERAQESQSPEEDSAKTFDPNLGETADQESARMERLQAKLQSIEEANLEEIELIQIRADQELEILTMLGASKDELLFAEIELEETIANRKSELLSKELSEKQKQVAEIAKLEKDREVKKLNQQKGFIQAAGILNSALFEDTKAVNAGLIVADTAVGIQKSLAIAPYDYANVAIIAATGVANLINNAGASKGGGSIQSAPTGASSGSGNSEIFSGSIQVNDTEQDFDGITTATLNVEFTADSGDQLSEAMALSINESVENGRIAGSV